MNRQSIDLEEMMNSLPDKVAEALIVWRTATLDREKMEALVYASTKATNDKLTATEIKSFINSNPQRYEAVLKEIKAESDYTRVYERLLSVKKIASLRSF